MESSGKHDLSEQRPLNGIKKVRKKFITLFGFKMPGVRISPLGPKVQNPLVRSLDFFVCMKLYVGYFSRERISFCTFLLKLFSTVS